MASVPELMAEARAEQALIASQLRALKGEPPLGDSPRSPSKPGQQPLSPTSSFSPKAPGFGAGLGGSAAFGGSGERGAGFGLSASPSLAGPPQGYPDEISALREHVAELDNEIAMRDMATEALREKVRNLQEALEKALLSPAEGGLWKDRYQTAQKENEVRGREIKELKLQMDVKDKEIKLLSQYVRKLEEEARIRDSQRERLLTDASISRSKFKQTEAEQQELVTRLHGLEDSFARCVGRVTQAATAGVVGVCLEEAQPVPRFAVLTRREPNGAVLEIFEEPDSHWELCAVELSPLGVGRKPPVGLDENALSLVTCGVAGGGVGSQEMVSCPAIKCPDRASFIKWSCAFRNLGLLPPYGAVAETPTSPKSPASPGARSEGASLATPALAQKDEALTETRLNSLLAAVEGNTSGEQRLEQRLLTRACVVVIRAHLPEQKEQNLLLLCYLRAYYAVAAWEEGMHWVNSHGTLMYLYCDSAILGLRLALRMQRLVFEFPDWAQDGIDKDLANCETSFAVSAGMEVGPVLPMRGSLFGEAFDVALALAELAERGELRTSNGACAAGLEDPELRRLRESGCLELSQKSCQVLGASFGAISAAVPDSSKLSIPMARGLPPGLEAAVEAVGRPDVATKESVVVAFYARSIGTETRAYRKPMQTLRLLLKFRDAVNMAVSKAQGEICWYQGHRVAGLFETSEQAVLCADEAQKEMALHNATRKGDFQLGMVCACDLGEVWRSTSVASPTAGPVLQRALGLAAAAGKVGDILATSELTAAKDWAKTAAHVEVSGEKAVVLDKDTVRFHTVSVQAAA